MKRLICVFDNYSNYMNVIIPLSMDFDEVFYIYHHEIDKRNIEHCSEILHKYKKNLIVKYIYIKNDEKEVTSLLNENTTVDISTSKYLSAFLFDKALKNNNTIIYYDDEETTIKDYRKHETIIDEVFKLNIEDMIILGGGSFKEQMHDSVDANDLDTINAITGVVENNLKDYNSFIVYVERINSLLRKTVNNELQYKLTDEIRNKIVNDDMYQKVKKYSLFEIKNNVLKFKNSYIRKMFYISGSFLENYIYIKLVLSNKFDQALMSQVIEFCSEQNAYQITCEIDCMAIKNNHMLFISCKSNKIDTDALNEIKIHSSVFGNFISKPVICTVEDISKKSPGEYLKAKELDIAVIDKTSFVKGTIADDLVSIIDGSYEYERVQ